MRIQNAFRRENISLILNTGDILFLFLIFLRSFDGLYVADFNFSLFYLDIVIVLFIFSLVWFFRRVQNFSRSWFDIFSVCIGAAILILWGLGFFLFYQIIVYVGWELPKNIEWYLGAFFLSRLMSLPLGAKEYAKLRMHSGFIGLSLLAFFVFLYIVLLPIKLFFADSVTNTHSALQMIGALLGMVYIFFTSIYVPRFILTKPHLEQENRVIRTIFLLLVAFGIGVVLFGIYIRFA